MALRRRQATSFNEEMTSSPSSSSLAAQAIKASAVHRDSSVSSAYYAASPASKSSSFNDHRSSKGSATYDYTSMGSTNEPGGFWGVLARKAKTILDDDAPRRFDTPTSVKTETVSTSNQVEHHYESFENSRKLDNPKFRKGLDRLASSLNQIGGSIGNALEEGRTIVDKKKQDIIQETRKLQNRRKGSNDIEQNQYSDVHTQLQESRTQLKQKQADQETQLKASRDVRWQLQQLLRPNYSFGS